MKNQKKATKAITALLLGTSLSVASPLTTSVYAQTGINYTVSQLSDNLREGLAFLNQMRTELGLAPLVVNEKLTLAAQAHADYLSYHQVFSHHQQQGTEKFVGAYAPERAQHFGYMNPVSEVISYRTDNSKNGITNLWDAPFHRIHLLDPNAKEVGLAQNIDSTGLNPQVINTGLSEKETEQIVAYPFNGQQNIATSWYNNEVPSPLSHIPNAPSTVGYPITLHGYGESVFGMYADDVSLTDDSGKDVPYYVFDGNQGAAYRTIIVFPQKPLASNKTYHVKVDYTIDLKNTDDVKKESKSWSFSTVQSQELINVGLKGNAANGYGLEPSFNTGADPSMKYEVFKDGVRYQHYNMDGDGKTKGKYLQDGQYTAKIYTDSQQWDISLTIKDGKVNYTLGNVPPVDTTAPQEVTDLKVSGKATDSITVTWTNPADQDFSKSNVYLDGQLVGSVTADKNSFKLDGLTADTTYRVEVKTVDATGNESSGASVQVKTDKVQVQPPVNPPVEKPDSGNTEDGTESKPQKPEQDLSKFDLIKEFYVDKFNEASIPFSVKIDPKTIHSKSVFMVDERGNLVEMKLTLSEDGKKLFFAPKEKLNLGESYTVYFDKELIRGVNGQKLPKSMKYIFNYNKEFQIPDLTKFEKNVAIFNNVEIDKKFEVTFTGPALDKTSITDKNIFALDEKNKLIEIEVELIDGHNLVVKPKDKWVSGKTITVYLDDTIKGMNGKYLNEPIKFVFTVK